MERILASDAFDPSIRRIGSLTLTEMSTIRRFYRVVSGGRRPVEDRGATGLARSRAQTAVRVIEGTPPELVMADWIQDAVLGWPFHPLYNRALLVHLDRLLWSVLLADVTRPLRMG